MTLPCWLASFVSIQLTFASLVGNTVIPDLLITFICNECDHGQPFRKDISQNEGENILSAEINERLKGKARDDEKRKWKPKKRGLCWECGSMDHWKKDCMGVAFGPPAE